MLYCYTRQVAIKSMMKLVKKLDPQNRPGRAHVRIVTVKVAKLCDWLTRIYLSQSMTPRQMMRLQARNLPRPPAWLAMSRCLWKSWVNGYVWHEEELSWKGSSSIIREKKPPWPRTDLDSDSQGYQGYQGSSFQHLSSWRSFWLPQWSTEGRLAARKTRRVRSVRCIAGYSHGKFQ